MVAIMQQYEKILEHLATIKQKITQSITILNRNAHQPRRYINGRTRVFRSELNWIDDHTSFVGVHVFDFLNLLG